MRFPATLEIAVLAACLVLGVAPGRAAVIREYAVQVDLRADSRFSVVETITVDFGSESLHGIMRHIPVRYPRRVNLAGVALPTRYAIRLDLEAVTDEVGNSYEYKTWGDGPNLRVRIGSPDVVVSGVKSYRIAYDVARAINYFHDHDELYWNVTGTEWPWPIERAGVLVRLPAGAAASDVRVRSFTGPLGVTGSQAEESSGAEGYRFAVADLRPGEGLTVLLGIPKGVLAAPGSLQGLTWFVVDNALPIALLLMPVGTVVLMTVLLLKYGRDPDRDKSIVVQYGPPADFTPALAGTVADERVDLDDMVSIPIDLAVRGYLKIRQLTKPKLLFLKEVDYEFVLLKPFEGHRTLKDHEWEFLLGLFGANALVGQTVLLSSLRHKFRAPLAKVRRHLYAELVERKLFPVSPEKVRSWYDGLGVLGLVVPLVLMVLTRPWEGIPDATGKVVAFGVFIASGLLTLAIFGTFARFMPRKTAKGAAAARHLFGFKEFIERVEGDRIARMAAEDPGVFGRVLPYARVLGVADDWADKFRDIALAPPVWYESATPLVAGPFDSWRFVRDVGTAMTAMGATFSSHVAAAGAGWSGGGGGSSGFTSGGGYSGGGFGGGGGGGW